MLPSRCQRSCRERAIGEMAPWTVALVFNVGLDDEWLGVNYNMYH